MYICIVVDRCFLFLSAVCCYCCCCWRCIFLSFSSSLCVCVLNFANLTPHAYARTNNMVCVRIHALLSDGIAMCLFVVLFALPMTRSFNVHSKYMYIKPECDYMFVAVN